MNRRVTFANVVSCIALFVALGGTSYAITKLPRNSVGSAQVRDRSLQAADLADSARVAGPRGPRGAVGPAGVRGPSDAYMDSPASKPLSAQANVGTVVAKLNDLPVGSYVLSSVAQTGDFTYDGEIVTCDIRVNGTFAAGSSVVIGNGAGSARASVLSAQTSVSQSSPFQATLECRADQARAQPPGVSNQHLTAVKVDSLHAG